jgi:drug/metabolite transporter (DMT)-like permease
VVALLLAAGSALVWGTGDFFGGKASQRADSLAVTVAAELAGLPVVGLCLLLVPGTPRPADLGWGALAGVAGLAGLALFYRALGAGAMSVTAPVTAVTSAALPLAVGLAVDRTPDRPALAGAVLAIAAIALVSAGGERGGPIRGYTIGLALLAGALFGLFFVVLDRASPASGAWPLLTVRLAAVAAGGALLGLRRRRPVLGIGPLRWSALAGGFDVAANALFLAAVQRGLLSVVAPIASLYPVSTVVLALLVDRERLRPLQVAGLGLAAAALVLTSA